VGMPLIVKFSRAIPASYRDDVERRMTVTATPAQEGSWGWISPTEVHYRPKVFWKGNSKVFANVRLGGVPLGNGYYGKSDLTVDLKIGRSFVMTVSNKNKQMIVKQDGDTISIDATLVMTQGERKVTETWKLNNTAEEFTPPAQQGAPTDARGKRTAYWLAGDRGAIMNEEIAAGGKTLSQTQRKWTLLPDGKTLIVDYFIDGPRGSYEAKRVFQKKD